MTRTYETHRTTTVKTAIPAMPKKIGRPPKGMIDVYSASGMISLDACLRSSLALQMLQLAEAAGIRIRYND